MNHPPSAKFVSFVSIMLTLFGLIVLGNNVAFAQAESARRQAGMWQQTQTLLAIDMPRAAPAINAAARASIGRPAVTDRVCVPATAVNRDTVASRLSSITPTASTFRWTQLDLRETTVRALGIEASGNISVDGKMTPILTDVIVTSHITDPVIGSARRVQRTVIVRLGPC